MKRLAFIRLGLGASAMTLAGILPGFGVGRSDPMSAWFTRHRVTVTARSRGLHMIARPSLCALASALQELHDMADGPLFCSGSKVTGSISGQAFHLELRTTGGVG